VKFDEPAAVGVPPILPLELSDSPGGREPVVIDHVYGPKPPEALSVAEYATPTSPFGSEVVVTEGRAIRIFTSIPSCAVADARAASERLTVKLKFPGKRGIPLISPVEALRESPGGKFPEAIDHA
jgi:hypothetical protein